MREKGLWKKLLSVLFVLGMVVVLLPGMSMTVNANTTSLVGTIVKVGDTITFSDGSSHPSRNGVGECAIIDMRELDELDKMFALRSLVSDLNRAKEQADREGWIDADEAERLLGAAD